MYIDICQGVAMVIKASSVVTYMMQSGDLRDEVTVDVRRSISQRRDLHLLVTIGDNTGGGEGWSEHLE